MKKFLLGITLVVSIFVSVAFSISVKADKVNPSVPYKTYAMGVHGDLTHIDAAYIPLGILNYNQILSSPNDLYIRDDLVYVANTGFRNILVFDLSGSVVSSFGQDVLEEPRGVYVDEEGFIYVADKSLQEVIKFQSDGTVVERFGRPTEVLFGSDADYKPEKVVVDKGGTIYVAGEGAVNGVIQLNQYGQFRGYFAVNRTGFDWRMRFSDLFLGITDELAKNLPPAPANLAIDHKGLIYTITSNITPGIKKYNMMSVPILMANYTSENLLVDIDVDKNENIYVIDDQAAIHQYDAYGRLLFRFGGLDDGNQRLGLINNPTGIAVDDYGTIYVLDRGYNNIQIFGQTEFVHMIQEANQAYLDGDMEQAETLWEQVYQMNSTFALSNSALGDIYLKENDYDEALDRYYAARDKNGYSEAFWEVRNVWLQANVGMILTGVVILTVFSVGLSLAGIKRRMKKKVGSFFKKTNRYRFIREAKLMGSMIKNPADTYYRIKFEKQSSVLTASVLYACFFILIIASQGLSSFLFNDVRLSEVNLLVEFATTMGILLLFVLANYLISTLSDGEGWFKDVYIASIYAFAPMFFGIVPLALLSNGLSYNEAFLYNFTQFILVAWSLILLVVMVKEIHNYSFGETVKNVVLTMFTMLILALLMFVVYMLFNQFLDFMISVVKEVVIRVQT